MHIDLNAFFVRCEEIKNPSLEGKPVLIGHEGRSGIVSTASYAARKMGCHSGQPMFQATKCCPDAIIIPPDFHFYHLMSTSFYAFLTQYSRIIEMASVSPEQAIRGNKTQMLNRGSPDKVACQDGERPQKADGPSFLT